VQGNVSFSFLEAEKSIFKSKQSKLFLNLFTKEKNDQLRAVDYSPTFEI